MTTLNLRKSALGAKGVAGQSDQLEVVIYFKAGGAMTEVSNGFKLPAELMSTGDPIEENPFPADDPRHTAWRDASLRAEEELCRLVSQFMGTTAVDGNDYIARSLALAVGKYDIWAKRYIQIVWSENAVRAFDKWLFDYANAWLDMFNNRSAAFGPKEDHLAELRSRLISRMEHWKAEARRYLSEQKAHLAGSGNTTRPQASEKLRQQESRSQPRKSRGQRSSALLANEVMQLLPKFTSGRETLRSAQRSWPTDKRRWESALKQEGFTDQADIDALMSSKSATVAAAKVIARKHGLDPRTVQNAVSESKRPSS